MQNFRLLSLLFFLLLAACASKPQVKPDRVQFPVVRKAPSAVSNHPFPSGLSVIRVARDMLGCPYRYGGSSPHGFDCSGLVRYAYRQAGIQLPRTSAEQYRAADKVPLSKLQPGDLLFFRLRPEKVSHVAIYDRDGRFIHAPSSGKSVSYASLNDPYWRQRLIAAGRFGSSVLPLN